jgi:hypothetical protein
MSRRLTIATVALTILVIVINTVHLTHVLDGALGFHWSAGLVKFLRSNTQGLVVLIVLAIIYQYAGLEITSRDQLEALKAARQFEQAVLDHAGADFLIATGLSQLMEHDAATAFTTRLMLDRPQMRSTTVSVEVLPLAGRDDIVTLRHRVECQWQSGRVLFALLRHHSDVAAVIRCLPEVTETRVHVSTHSPSFDDVKASKTLATDNPFQCLSGAGWRVPPLQALGARTVQGLAGRAGVRLEDIAFFEGKVESASRLAILNVQDQEASTRWTWWQADRMIEVQSVIVDVSALQIANPTLQVFWRPTDVGHHQPWPGRWEFGSPMWLTPGDGLCVMW